MRHAAFLFICICCGEHRDAAQLAAFMPCIRISALLAYFLKHSAVQYDDFKPCHSRFARTSLSVAITDYLWALRMNKSSRTRQTETRRRRRRDVFMADALKEKCRWKRVQFGYKATVAFIRYISLKFADHKDACTVNAYRYMPRLLDKCFSGFV